MGTANTFHGWSYRLNNGISIGFNWVHGNGITTKRIACIASYHHPKSVTWRWALFWNKPKGVIPKLSFKNSRYGYFGLSIPIFGGLVVNWQPHMMRKGGA